MAVNLEFPCDVERLPNGHTMITDAGDEASAGSEVFEIDGAGQVVWEYHEGLRFAHSARRLPSGCTLICDTLNDRLIEVSAEGRLTWSSESWGGGTGKLSDGSHLAYPNDAHDWGDGSLLVTDRNNDRVVRVSRGGEKLWEYRGNLRHPHNADRLANGHVLLADSDHNAILEISPAGEIVWRFDNHAAGGLSFPRDADRLPNGNTLITDSRNHRVLEVTADGQIVWSYGVDYYASFYEADALANGHVLIADQHHHQVLEVDRFGNLVWLFRNRRHTRLVFPRLKNGSFRERDATGTPSGWMLHTRFAEGGGELVWDESDARPAPGIRMDRSGGLYLAQHVAATPGTPYHLAGKVRTQDIASGKMACLQMFFLDAYGGPIVNTAQAPSGQAFTGTNPWTQDHLEAIAPPRTTTVEVRLLLNGPGIAWVKEVMLYS